MNTLLSKTKNELEVLLKSEGMEGYVLITNFGLNILPDYRGCFEYNIIELVMGYCKKNNFTMSIFASKWRSTTGREHAPIILIEPTLKET